MGKRIAFFICVLVSTLAFGGNPAQERLDITTTNGVLTATLHTEAGGVVTFEYEKDGCYFSPDHPDPCFTFAAINGTEAIPISGCVSNNDAKFPSGNVGCPTKGLKGVQIVLASGGNLVLYGGNGDHKDCSPVPVTIDAQGDAFHVGVWNKCTETVTCRGGGIGQVDADKSDTVNNCQPGFVTRH